MANVSIRNVRKSFGATEIIHGLELEIDDGEFIVIVGPSGCGKSTLLRLIAGLEAITAGDIEIAGRVVNNVEPKNRDVAMVFQNYALYPHMTAFQNMGYSLRVARRPKAEIKEKVTKVATILEINDLLDRKPSQLSGGQRQRVAMGRAIIREPAVFLFDEPLSNLDAKLRVQMRVEIKRLHRKLAATSIFVTHDQVEAMTMADRLVVMNEGNIEQIGTPAEVYKHPESIFVGSFIGSPPMNFFSGEIAHGGQRISLGEDAYLPFCNAGRNLTTGDNITVGIRPEDIRLSEKGELKVRFNFVEELGSGRLLHLIVAGQPFIVHTADEIMLDTGQSLSASVAPENIHLFNSTSEKRIGA